MPRPSRRWTRTPLHWRLKSLMARWLAGWDSARKASDLTLTQLLVREQARAFEPAQGLLEQVNLRAVMPDARFVDAALRLSRLCHSPDGRPERGADFQFRRTMPQGSLARCACCKPCALKFRRKTPAAKQRPSRTSSVRRESSRPCTRCSTRSPMSSRRGAPFHCSPAVPRAGPTPARHGRPLAAALLGTGRRPGMRPPQRLRAADRRAV